MSFKNDMPAKKHINLMTKLSLNVYFIKKIMQDVYLSVDMKILSLFAVDGCNRKFKATQHHSVSSFGANKF